MSAYGEFDADDFITKRIKERKERETYIKTTGFSIVSDELVQALLPYSPLLEIGAGTGSLAAAVVKAGGRVVAVDNYSSYGLPGWHGSNFRVIHADACRATRLLRYTKDVNVLCSWPSLNEDWCTKAIKLLPKDRFFAYIGEGPNGCTGDDTLYHLLDEEFVLVKEVPITQWWGINDELCIYKKLTPPSKG